MRVTENMNYNTIRDSVRRSRERMDGLQQQHATLKKLNTPSDDPIGAAKVLQIRTEKMTNDQYYMNGKLAETFLSNTDHALGEISDLIVRAKEIALGQASGASSNDETRLGVAEEVSQLYKQAISVANRRIGDQYLFAGYKTHKPPMDENGNYQGDLGNIMVEIAKEVYLTTNVPGIEAFNTSPKASTDSDRIEAAAPEGNAPEGRAPASVREGGEQEMNENNVNVFDELQNVRIGLLTGDVDGIRNTLDRLDKMHGHVVATRAKVGSRLQGLQSANTAIERHNITSAQLNTFLEDADMAQVVSDLAREETIFRSALQSSQKLVQPTLMDFLK